jgi:hypothetical protein
MNTLYTPRELELLVKHELAKGGANYEKDYRIQIRRTVGSWDAVCHSNTEQDVSEINEVSRRVADIGTRLAEHYPLIGG